jgi:hypothetical protein
LIRGRRQGERIVEPLLPLLTHTHPAPARYQVDPLDFSSFDLPLADPRNRDTPRARLADG